MALVLADRVRETTTSTGTGPVTLAGAVSGFQSFSVIGDTNTTFYCIADQTGTNWETGVGTYTASGTTLSRDTILASSNGGSIVTFTSGIKDVFVTVPSEKLITSHHGHFDQVFDGTTPDGLVIDYAHPFGRISVETGDGVRIFTGGVATTQIAEFKSNGDTDITGVLTVGGGSNVGGATNPQIAASGSSSTYVQAYIHNDNPGASASADLAAYPDNGVDSSGWVDLGITSSAYNDATYTITGPNESYLFASAPFGASKTGNLVYATDSTGTQNAHQWYVGGFNQLKSAYKMQLTSSGFDLRTALLLTGAAGTANQLLASAGAGAVPTWTDIKTVNGNSLLGSGNVTVSASPAGVSGEVQYNNAGALAGATNIEVENGYLRVPDTGAVPATPAAAEIGRAHV